VTSREEFSCRPRVDGVLQLENSAFDIDGDLLGEVAGLATAVADERDVAHLPREVRRHEIHVVGQIFPGARDTINSNDHTLGTFAEQVSTVAREVGIEESWAVRPKFRSHRNWRQLTDNVNQLAAI